MEVAHNKWEEDGGHGGGGGNRRPMRMSGREDGGGGGSIPFSKMVFDGKRMRKAIQRRTVDYNHSVARWMQERVWIRDRRDTRYLRPDPNFIVNVSVHCWS